MWTNVEHTHDVTTFMVTTKLCQNAQSIIETYVGKTEEQVDNPADKALLALATAYQAAYMFENWESVFQQIPVKQLSVAGSTYTLTDENSPYIAGLARMACKNLSWRKGRSVHTGPVGKRPRRLAWERD